MAANHGEEQQSASAVANIKQEDGLSLIEDKNSSQGQRGLNRHNSQGIQNSSGVAAGSRKTFLIMPHAGTGGSPVGNGPPPPPSNAQKGRYKPIQPKGPLGNQQTTPGTPNMNQCPWGPDISPQTIEEQQVASVESLGGPSSWGETPGNGEEQQLSELRKLLQENLPNGPGSVDDNLVGLRDLRKVSFQTDDSTSALQMAHQRQQQRARLPLGFTPIPCPPHGLHSAGSSPPASPFMSPRGTPGDGRSRHNSGQTTSGATTTGGSNYVTPRSTPVDATPFMSPQGTPMGPRSRHNSQGAIRTPYPPGPLVSNRSRHSSGTLRLAPYPSQGPPRSAPLSPLVQGNPTGGTGDRRRHVSAGPTVHYPPPHQQLGAHLSAPWGDPLSQEISNSLAIHLTPPAGSIGRPQSVPLPQIAPGGDLGPKSQPCTPLAGPNQQFFPNSNPSTPGMQAPPPTPLGNLGPELDDFVGQDYPLEIGGVVGGAFPPLSVGGEQLHPPPNVNPFLVNCEVESNVPPSIGVDDLGALPVLGDQEVLHSLQLDLSH